MGHFARGVCDDNAMLNFPDSPTLNQSYTPGSGATSWTWDGTKWVAGAAHPKYVIGTYVPGTMTASQSLLYHRFTKAVTLPANLGAYLGHTTVAGGGVAATGSTAIVLQQATAAAPTTFSTVATITVAAAGVNGAMSTQAAINFAQGDVLRVRGPATADSTFADFHLSLVGQET